MSLVLMVLSPLVLSSVPDASEERHLGPPMSELEYATRLGPCCRCVLPSLDCLASVFRHPLKSRTILSRSLQSELERVGMQLRNNDAECPDQFGR